MKHHYEKQSLYISIQNMPPNFLNEIVQILLGIVRRYLWQIWIKIGALNAVTALERTVITESNFLLHSTGHPQADFDFILNA